MTQAPDKFNPKEPRRRMPKPVWVYPLSTVFIWGVGLVLFFEFFDAIKIIALGLLASASVAAALRPVAERIPGPAHPVGGPDGRGVHRCGGGGSGGGVVAAGGADPG